MEVRRGEIYIVDNGYQNKRGSEQKGNRPALVIQNDKGNKHSTTTIVALLTSKEKLTKYQKPYPMHFEIPKDSLLDSELEEDSIVLCEQLFTIDKSRLKERIGELDPDTDLFILLDKAIKISLELE